MDEKGNSGDVLEEYLLPQDFDNKKSFDFKDKIAIFVQSPWYIVAVLILVAIIAYSLGRLSLLDERMEPVRVISGEPANVVDVITPQNQNTVVASKSGQKYHYPWCTGAKQIAEKNRITFNSIEEARAKGYTPASNCKGLK